MRIGLIPLDERPVNTRYPALIAQIAGVELLLPPADVLSSLRTPARCHALADWLELTASGLDALIVALEMLGYGGLIASRITDEPALKVVERLNLLHEIKRRHPALQLLGSGLITRISNADVGYEEPDYWWQYGTRMYRLSQLFDRREAGEPVFAELQALQTEIPTAHTMDFLGRRLRNHTVNLSMLQLLAQGGLDLLVLSSDDTSPHGLQVREKRWLTEWADCMQLGERLLMYPGADEVGCVLLARLLNARRGRRPRFQVRYAIPGGEQVVAAYEDGPIDVTVERQIKAVGGIRVEAEPDVLLAVNSPLPRGSEWHPDYAAEDRSLRLDALQALADEIAAAQQAGLPVVVADVAYPNGADPVLIELLRERVDLPALAAYGGWNTAGNTIGTALAQGCAAWQLDGAQAQAAQQRFLLHRFIEDWGYQHWLRGQLRDWLAAETGQREPAPEQVAAACQWLEPRFNALINELPGFAGRYRIVPGSVRLPWGRTFEVDFELERRPAPGEAS